MQFCYELQTEVFKNWNNKNASKYSVKTKAIKHRNMNTEKQTEFAVNAHRTKRAIAATVRIMSPFI